jgi:hypothetical protein
MPTSNENDATMREPAKYAVGHSRRRRIEIETAKAADTVAKALAASATNTISPSALPISNECIAKAE